MIRFLLAVIAVVALVWFAAAKIPLGYVMRKLPLNPSSTNVARVIWRYIG